MLWISGDFDLAGFEILKDRLRGFASGFGSTAGFFGVLTGAEFGVDEDVVGLELGGVGNWAGGAFVFEAEGVTWPGTAVLSPRTGATGLGTGTTGPGAGATGPGTGEMAGVSSILTIRRVVM